MVEVDAQPRVLDQSLIEYLWTLPRDLAETCGWALLDAAARPPLISWVTQIPLLTVRPAALDAWLATGQIYRPEVLRQVLGIAGILHHSRKEEWMAPKLQEEALREASEGLPQAWIDLLWVSGIVDLQTHGSSFSAGGGFIARLTRISRISPIAAEAAGWMFFQNGWGRITINLEERYAKGQYPLAPQVPMTYFSRLHSVLTLAGILHYENLEDFLRASQCTMLSGAQARW